MPNVPQSLPDSSSQNRDKLEKRGLRQSCSSAVLMVILTGGTATAVVASAGWLLANALLRPGGADALADDCAVVGAVEIGSACCFAQRSKQVNRASLSAVCAAHCCHVGSGALADAMPAVWPSATEAAPRVKAQVNTTRTMTAGATASPAVCAKRTGEKCC